jgi:hypothetical protein
LSGENLAGVGSFCHRKRPRIYSSPRWRSN